MLVKIYNDNPNSKQIRKVVDNLRQGAIVIIPTDTIYAICCSLSETKSIEKMARMKGMKVAEANFSLLCKDFSGLSEYCKPISNTIFKAMKKNLPGPFTFILPANGQVPKLFRTKRKTIGIRVPDNSITEAIIDELGEPLVATSVRYIDENKEEEYTTDPELIYEIFENKVDMVIDGGYGNNVASTIVDCTQGELEIIREGVGELIQ